MEKISIPFILKMIYKEKTSFFFCFISSISKAIFYGGIFVYEVKRILMGIEIQNIALLYESTIQLFAAILAIALFDVLYTKIITKRINIVIALLEDQLINKLKCYFSFSGQKKLTILQNSVTNAVKCISTFFYGLIYLSIVLLCSITYGMIINFWVVGSGVILSSILVIISCKYGKNLLEKCFPPFKK